MDVLHLIREIVPRQIRYTLRKTLNGLRSRRFRREMARLRASHGHQWALDRVRVDDKSVEIEGWSLAPSGDTAAVGFTINGHPFDRVDYPRPRQDVAQVFPDVPWAERSGFHCRAVLSHVEAFPDGFMALRTVDRRSGRPLQGENTHYYPDASCFDTPLPDAARRRRVHGDDNEGGFLSIGASAFNWLRTALRNTVGKDLQDFPRVLDWGCGCGRVTRYFRDLPGVAVTGIDIDADNIRWCSRNLGFGTFVATKLHPPTPLPANAFDLLFGISIFTHLTEADQLNWLAELKRIAAPGAILLMTIHAAANMAVQDPTSPATMAHYHAWKNHGFVDVGGNPNIDGVIADSQNYYRNIFHSHGYVRAVWGRYFRVLAIVPGYNGNHDLVVMQKPE